MANGPYHASERQFKFLLIGNETVGKTSLALKFTQDKFEKQYKPTMGVDFFLKRLMLPGGVSVTVQLWDIGGQSLSGQMFDKYLYGAHAILFIYDITNNSTFEALNDWMEIVHQVFQEESIMPHLALIGNKSDMEHSRAVKLDRHMKFSLDNGMSSHCVCAKTGESVALCFQKIAGELLGIRLTRSEQETVQPVVKAEIVQSASEHPPDTQDVSSSSTGKPSSVCILQ